MPEFPEIYFEVLGLLRKWRRKQNFYEWCEDRGQGGIGQIICGVILDCQLWVWMIICVILCAMVGMACWMILAFILGGKNG